MKRFVTYIYEYDRGARGRNVGFVRTDIRKTFGLQGYEKMKKADLIANLMREDPKEENSNKDDHDKSVHSRDQQPGSNHEPREPT